MAIADKPTEVSEQVLESVKTGQQAAIEAVRKFVDIVDQALPRLGGAPSVRQRVIDSGLEMISSASRGRSVRRCVARAQPTMRREVGGELPLPVPRAGSRVGPLPLDGPAGRS